uniref:Uncharacterized protein n=1 Tax=Arundo donax TaxID=35708 RepID=A0A0A9FQG1_ARUDO
MEGLHCLCHPLLLPKQYVYYIVFLQCWKQALFLQGMEHNRSFGYYI